MPLPSFVKIPLPQLRPDGSVLLDGQGRPVAQRDPRTGQPIFGLGINPDKQAVKNYWVPMDAGSGAVTVTLGAAAVAGQAGALSEVEFLIDSSGHFDWAYFVGFANGDFTIEFFDPGTNRLLQNRAIHSDNVMGSAARPFHLPEPYFFNVGDAERVLIARLRNLETSTITVRLALIGRKFYHKEAAPRVAMELQQKFQRGERTYAYWLMPEETNMDGTVANTIATLAANGSAVLTFSMDDSADTELHKLMVSSTGAFTFQLRERDTNRLLSNGLLRNAMGWGTAEFPFLFADTFLLERKKQLLLEITDISGLQNRIFACAAGRRLYFR